MNAGFDSSLCIECIAPLVTHRVRTNQISAVTLFGEMSASPRSLSTRKQLIAAGHAYTDGNKRTALASVELFYDLNGYRFEYGHEVEETLEDFAINTDLVDIDAVESYLEKHTTSA